MSRRKINFSFQYLHPLTDAKSWEKSLQTKSERFWQRRGEEMQLCLFRDMTKRVPAYAQFLRAHNIDPRTIKTQADLHRVPALNKDNYLRAYPLPLLCWDGDLAGMRGTISSTSGSTGEPFYFPRTVLQDDQYALLAELYLRANFSIEKKRTLYINAFPLGVWIGGLFTYSAITRVAERGEYPLSIINPGISIPAVLKAVSKFQNEYDQILIGSYGPFLKDIIDEGVLMGIKWKQIDLGFIFSAEVFSEEFRKHVLSHTKKQDKLIASLNHYGTVDLGTMAYETPLAVLSRQLIKAHPRLAKEVFHDAWKTPTLTQYIPELFFFEEDERDRLYVSGYSGIPLIRYDLKDRGNCLSKKELEDRFRNASVPPPQLQMKSSLRKHTVWDLPFVQVFERTDFSVSYYAFQVYPETIRRALLHRSLAAVISGKFSMHVEYNKKFQQQLTIHIETMPNIRVVSAKARAKILAEIHKRLSLENSEYAKTYHEKGSRVLPVLQIHLHGDATYFASGTKQKWVK